MKLHAYSHIGTNKLMYEILPPQVPKRDPLLCVWVPGGKDEAASQGFQRHLLLIPLLAVLTTFPGVSPLLVHEEEACQVDVVKTVPKCCQLPGSKSPIS